MSEGPVPSGVETDIAVVGMAGRFPGARSVAAFWRNLRDGVESVRRYGPEELAAAGVDPALAANPDYVPAGAPLDDMEMFDASFFGFNPREASIMDPQHRQFLECAWEALEDAGHVPERFAGSIGVFAGSGHNAYMPYNLFTNPALMRSVGLFLVRHTGNDKDFLTTRASYLLNLRGPSINVQTACSTSLVAVHLGCQSLLNGECDMVLAGGVTIELPHRQGYLYQDGEILSPDGHCRAFDQAAAGTLFGSGVGIVVLRRLADALADGDHIHAVIKGSAVNNDGSGKVGYLAPSVDGQAQAIAEALAVAGVEPQSVSYVEAHGTGTPVGDPIEVAALTEAFGGAGDRTGFCGLGSVKTNIGHLDTAAGVASFIKVALALQHKQLPPTLHFQAPNPALQLERSPFYVNAELREWTSRGPRRAGVSSLGVGGTNAYVVLEEAPAALPAAAARPWQLLPLSAKSAEALERATDRLADHLREATALNLADAAYTLQVGRQSMTHRRVVVAGAAAEAADLLAARDRQRVFSAAEVTEGRSVAFLFAGGGAQYPGMGEDLYRDEPIYRAAVDLGLEVLAPHVDFDLRPLLFPPPSDRAAAAARLAQPSRALPALFITQMAQATLWRSWGIEPSAMIGHSMGEYTAAHLAGVLTLDDALALVALRGRLFEQVPEGGMLSVALPAEELAGLLGPDLSLAAVNGPALSVASGPREALARLEAQLAEREVDSVRIHIDVAAHSAMLQPILAEFEAFFSRVRLRPPTLPFVSNLSGTWITEAEATDPRYWVRHLRETVRFADGIAELLRDPKRVFLEVGPGRTLATLTRQHPACRQAEAVLNSLRHPDESTPDQAFMLTVLGRLWLAGVAVDWDRLRGDAPRRRVPLPTYPFERQRHWIEPGRSAEPASATGDPLARRDDISQWFYQPVWRRTPRPAAGAHEPGRTLVLLDGDGPARGVADALAAAGESVVVARLGDAFARVDGGDYILPPADRDAFGRLFSALAADGLPNRIIHAWGAGSAADEAGRQLDRSFHSLVALMQAVGEADLPGPLQLTVLTEGALGVGDELVRRPLLATLLGAVRVIGREYPDTRCRLIDIPSDRGAPARWVERLLRELDDRQDDDVVALRSSGRWVRRFESIPLPPPAPGGGVLRDGGVYLVTGGFGGLGLALAEHVARAAGARIALLGRHAPPPRDQWPAYLAAHGSDDRTAGRIRAVEAIEAAGGEVLLLEADVTDPAATAQAVAEVRRRFGALHGVFHTAGVLDDRVIQLKTRESAEAVLAPKVQGTLALEAALGDAELDLFVLYSSVSALTGLAGQVDYAAANAFLDAFAQARSAAGRGPTVAVNWSAWREVGMAAELARELGLEQGVSGGRPTGHPLVEQCLRDTADERVYASHLSPATHWLLAEHRLRDGQALIPGTGYLELARAAFEQHPQDRAVELTDVAFLAPFAVADDATRELRVELRRNGHGAAFRILSPWPGDEPDAWQEHVTGRIGYRDGAGPSQHPLEEIRARCSERVIERTGQEQPAYLRFGPRWANLHRIAYGRHEALLTLELPAAFRAELDQCRLHPALLDMATAGAQELITGFEPARDFYVPMSYGGIVLHRGLPARLFSHVRYRPEDSTPGDFAVFDVALLDEAGQEVALLREFTMIRVRDLAQLTPTATGRRVSLTPLGASRPQAMANKILEVGLRAGLRPAEGLAALERILADGTLPQVVVSPQDLAALTEALDHPPEANARDAQADSRPAGRDLGAVERALTAHEAVREVAALDQPDAAGGRQPVAYVVYDPAHHATVSELRRYLRDQLDEDLVPRTFIDLDALPRNADGEVDRVALVNPFGVVDEVVAPRTATEGAIAELWRDLLGDDKVSIHDNFFDIGGHSLLSVRFIARLDKKLGVRLQHEHIVVNTLEQLAAKCDLLLGAAEDPATDDEPRRAGFLSSVKASVFGGRS